MSELAGLVRKFVATVGAGEVEIYNEFSLQHELGLFLRVALPQYRVQFERNVQHFASSKNGFTKREIDISVFSPDKSSLKFAIELKYPRNGQYPEQMYSFCTDIAFAEELKAAGFGAAALLIFVDHPLFYKGAGEGIYGHFRAGRPITGRIDKPTGSSGEFVQIRGSYEVTWLLVDKDIYCALIEV